MPPEASAPALPALVCDSPHSGTGDPADFDCAVEAAVPRANAVREDIAEARCEINAHIHIVTTVR